MFENPLGAWQYLTTAAMGLGGRIPLAVAQTPAAAATAGIRNRPTDSERGPPRRLLAAWALARIRAKASGSAEKSSARTRSAARTLSSSVFMMCSQGSRRARPDRGSNAT